MDRETAVREFWQAFNPVSMTVGFVYGAFAIAAVRTHEYAPVGAVEASDDDESDEDEMAA